MRLVFMGTPDFAVSSLKALCEAGHEVAAVFTQADKPKGRGYKVTPTPVKAYALGQNIPIYQPKSLKKDGEEYIEILRQFAPDCIVVAAYGKILPKAVLDIPRLGCVNVHASLLPKYRGAAPIQRAILDGAKTTGVTTMLMGEGLDTGDMLLKSETEIGENETSAELFDRLAELGAELVVRTLDGLEKGEITPEPQDDGQATYAAMITKDMCMIDFTDSAFRVHKQICGLSDSPCAFTLVDGKRLKIYHSQVVSTEATGHKPGTLEDGKHFDVACGEGIVRFTEVQAEGSKRMNAEDYLRGRQLKPGFVLGA